MPRVREQNAELRDEIRQPLFDTFDLLNAVNPSTLGVVSFFSNVQGKPRSQTNLRQNNLLEATVSYRILGMHFDSQNIYAANVSGLPLIMENSFIELKVGEKIYWTGNATYVAGRQHTFAAAPAAPVVYQRFGQIAVQGVMLSGKHVVDIPPLQSFRVDWGIETLSAAEITSATPGGGAGTKTRFLLSLKGLQRRPVQ